MANRHPSRESLRPLFALRGRRSLCPLGEKPRHSGWAELREPYPSIRTPAALMIFVNFAISLRVYSTIACGVLGAGVLPDA